MPDLPNMNIVEIMSLFGFFGALAASSWALTKALLFLKTH